MRTTSLRCFLALALLGGCSDLGSSDQALTEQGDPQAVANPEDVDYDGDDCVKIENEEIGTDLTLDVAGTSVSVHSWVTKTGEPNEYRGFSYSSESEIVYRVKSGGELFYGSARTWANPNGEGGSEVSAVSNIVFCPPDDGGAPDGGTGTCNNPDGCGGGGGGGAPDAGTAGCNDPDGCDGGTGGPIIP
jgi:hypothetical protein